MSEQWITYDQTLVAINKNHASTLSTTRYNPWALALQFAAALAFPVAAFYVGWLAAGDVAAALACLVSLPVPVLVLPYVLDCYYTEHGRMVAQLALYQRGPLLPTLPVEETSYVGSETRLTPGLLQNGEVVARAADPTAAAVWLRNACLKLARGGQVRGGWSRSALAEGDDKLMLGEEWDAASPELQRLGMFWVRPGKHGGLEPTPGKDVAESIKLLEVAR